MSLPLTRYHEILEIYCAARSKQMALEIHAHTRIPLRKATVEALNVKMLQSAMQATDDDDVTVRVNEVQDAFVEGIKYRTPRMWRFCHKMAIVMAMRLHVTAKKSIKRRGIAWRAHMTRVLRQRFFKQVVEARNDDDVNDRLGVVYDAMLAAYDCV